MESNRRKRRATKLYLKTDIIYEDRLEQLKLLIGKNIYFLV